MHLICHAPQPGSSQPPKRRVREIQMGTVAGRNIYIFQQAGIATYPEDGGTITELLESAQRYLAMRAGMVESDPGKDESSKGAAEEASGISCGFVANPGAYSAAHSQLMRKPPTPVATRTETRIFARS